MPTQDLAKDKKVTAWLHEKSLMCIWIDEARYTHDESAILPDSSTSSLIQAPY